MSDNFYFFHGSSMLNLPFLLSDGTIRLSTEMVDIIEKYDLDPSFGGRDYAYCGIYFPDIMIYDDKHDIFSCGILLNKSIMNDQIVIFNSGWYGGPLETFEKSEQNLRLLSKNLQYYREGDYIFYTMYPFSVYLNPADPEKVTKFKMEIIYNYMKKVLPHLKGIGTTHEFLFTKSISIKNKVEMVLHASFYGNDDMSDLAKILTKKISKKKKIKIVKYGTEHKYLDEIQ
jgi:hypothetical protein